MGVKNISYLKFAVKTKQGGMQGVHKLHFFPIMFLKQKFIVL